LTVLPFLPPAVPVFPRLCFFQGVSLVSACHHSVPNHCGADPFAGGGAWRRVFFSFSQSVPFLMRGFLVSTSVQPLPQFSPHLPPNQRCARARAAWGFLAALATPLSPRLVPCPFFGLAQFSASLPFTRSPPPHLPGKKTMLVPPRWPVPWLCPSAARPSLNSPRAVFFRFPKFFFLLS